MEIITQIIGFSAAIVGTSLMLPQAIKSYRSKHMGDVSTLMLIFYFFNCLLWVIYGYLINSWPVFASNFIGFIISVFQLALKKKYSKT